MNINNSSYLQDLMISSAVTALIVSSVLNATAIPVISILVGFIVGTFLPRFLFKKKWNNREFINIPEWKKYATCAIPAAIGSQMGWAALLV